MRALILIAIFSLSAGCASKLKMMKDCKDTQIDQIWLCNTY